MAEPAGTRVESNSSRNIGSEPKATRSYVAMFLSIILPGLGQLYLGHFLKAFIVVFGVASALGIVYLNSMPVEDWRDLTRFKPPVKTETTEDETGNAAKSPGYAIHIWTFDDGEQLMYRPSWKLKISGLIQGVLCWLYAIGDGWRGRRGRRRP